MFSLCCPQCKSQSGSVYVEALFYYTIDFFLSFSVFLAVGFGYVFLHDSVLPHQQIWAGLQVSRHVWLSHSAVESGWESSGSVYTGFRCYSACNARPDHCSDMTWYMCTGTQLNVCVTWKQHLKFFFIRMYRKCIVWQNGKI